MDENITWIGAGKLCNRSCEIATSPWKIQIIKLVKEMFQQKQKGEKKEK